MKRLLCVILPFATLACGYWGYSALKPKPVSQAPIKQADVKTDSKETVQQALRDASLIDLIKNARVATRKGDEVTRTAMVAGLRKEPARAKILIQREKTKTKDETDVAILTRIEGELP